MEKLIVCTVCPMSCEVKLTIDEATNEVIKVEGNKCPRGKKYALKEFTAPERTLTSTVKIINGVHPLLPVRTDKPIPKGQLFAVMELTKEFQATAPVQVGDVLIENILNTGANLIASRNIPVRIAN